MVWGLIYILSWQLLDISITGWHPRWIKPYRKLFAKQEDQSEDGTDFNIFLHRGTFCPNIRNWKSVCKKKKKSDAGCPDFSVLSCQPFKPLFEKLSSPRLLPVLSCWHGSDSRRRISRGTVPVGTLRKAGKQSSGKQEHFARDFCEIGVSVHSPVQETPSNCEPF